MKSISIKKGVKKEIKAIRKYKKEEYLIILLLIVSLIGSFFIDVKTIMIIMFSFLLLISHFLYREKIDEELAIAFLIAFAWTSYYVYEYTTGNLMFGRINLFPLVAWTFGLVVLREIYEKLNKYKFLKICIIYLVGLFLVEYIGYWLLNIKLNSNFPSFLGIGIMHAPVMMKIFYLIAGPIYILFTQKIGVK